MWCLLLPAPTFAYALAAFILDPRSVELSLSVSPERGKRTLGISRRRGRMISCRSCHLQVRGQSP